MDPEYSLQDVVRCHLCETPSPSLHCNVCDKHVCKDCEEKHLSDESRDHKIVPFKFQGRCTCQKHPLKICERYCEQCDIPICVECASAEHSAHEHVDVKEKLEREKHILQGHLQELNNSIYKTYRDIEYDIQNQITGLIQNSEIVKNDIDKHGENMQRKIESAIKTLKSDLDKVFSENLAVLNKKREYIKHILTEINQSIADINRHLTYNDVSLVSSFKSRNVQFKNYPTKSKITFSRFVPRKINKEWISQQFGHLSKHNYIVDDIGVGSSSSENLRIDLAPVIIDIETDYMLSSISCENDEDIWTCGYRDNTLKLYKLQGELVKSVKTIKGTMPRDIAVTRNGDLVYTDNVKKTVNIVNNEQNVIKLEEWTPDGVCSTSSGELLVVMISEDGKQTKVVRYSGFIEKQIIQFDDKGQPLYSSGQSTKYISENRNLDICVSDNTANAVVVVNQTGKLRFIYKGRPSVRMETIYPRGITTDSQGRILIADSISHRIHILDQDGQFLCCLYDSLEQRPFCLCLDTRDNLFVADMKTAVVKKNPICHIDKMGVFCEEQKCMYVHYRYVYEKHTNKDTLLLYALYEKLMNYCVLVFLTLSSISSFVV